MELLGIDVASLALGPLIASALLVRFGFAQGDAYASYAVLVAYATVAVMRGAYSTPALLRALESVRLALFSLVTAVLLILMVAFLLKSGAQISRMTFGTGALTSALLLAGGRLYFTRQVKKFTAGTLTDSLVIVQGKPLRSHALGTTIVDADAIGLRPDLHDPAMIAYFGQLVQNFDRVVVDSDHDHRAWALFLKGANINGEILVERSNDVGVIALNQFQGSDTLVVARQPLGYSDRLKKRLLDLAITVPLIVMLSPLLLVVALAIKLDSSGPVFFRQDRVGRGNRLFKVLKFRSMYVERCDAQGQRSASRADDRITRIGKFIRSTSIDELPQLLNVLSGDMSLVGPRPHALGSLAGDRLFWQVDDTYWLRHQLKPGITGLAQVRGFRGATTEARDLTDRLRSDMEYIQGWDIWRDIAVLANTFRVIVHKNAF